MVWTLVGVEFILAVLLAGVTAALVWMRSRERERIAEHEREKAELNEAISRLGQGDFSNPAAGSDAAPQSELVVALNDALPSIRNTVDRLENASRRDHLTGLLNPVSFRHACQAVLGKQDGDGGVLLYFDIDDFKEINDSLGHNAGDQFLKTCADRMRLAAASFKQPKMNALAAGQPIADLDAIIGRLGGDEFGIFLPGPADKDEVEKFILRLKRMIGEPSQLGAHSLRAKISVGAAFSSATERAYDKLLNAADTAMYEAKANGGGGMEFYEPTMRNRADRILDTELELREGLQKGQFCLYYQPQVQIASGRVVCAEALIRWNHPTRGLVMPGDFMPFVEAHGLIDDIGDWVINEAIRTAAQWWADGREIKVAINVSPNQLHQVELIPMIRACLKHYNLPPHALEVEFTEEALMLNDDIATERIKGLRRDGVSIALDDFGTGYSNISQLLALPMDQLKLDRSLLIASASGRRRRMVLLAIIGLAKKLGVNVVAEGVETQGQLDFLLRTGFPLAQGYFFSRPLPENEFLRWVDRHGSDATCAAA